MSAFVSALLPTYLKGMLGLFHSILSLQGLLFLIEVLGAVGKGAGVAPTGDVADERAVAPTGDVADERAVAPRIAILVPAHNEAAEIQRTLTGLMPQLREADQLVVIAHNCSDRTAELARQVGATVLENKDLNRRGKGYALDYGYQFLAAAPPEQQPEIVIVVDADCEVEPGSILALARRAQATQRPVQGTYLLKLPTATTLRDRLSLFAFTVKNKVRPLGLARFGLPCVLTGSGMAFPWSVLRDVSLAGEQNVEDMQLTVDLALAGFPPLYEPKAQIWGRILQSEAATGQRTRWEHGHLQIIRQQVPRLLGTGCKRADPKMLALALDLAIPPLSLFVVLWLGLLLAEGTAILTGWLSSQLLWGIGLPGLFLMLALVLAWFRFGQTLLPWQEWAGIPRYLLWKLPIYLQFVLQPKLRWSDTERPPAEAKPEADPLQPRPNSHGTD